MMKGSREISWEVDLLGVDLVGVDFMRVDLVGLTQLIFSANSKLTACSSQENCTVLDQVAYEYEARGVKSLKIYKPSVGAMKV